MKDILILAEHRQGEFRDITFEMLSLGNRLALENHLELSAVLLGDEVIGRLN